VPRESSASFADESIARSARILTKPLQRRRGGMFSVALSVEESPTLAQRTRKNGPPPSRTLSGTLLCGVRTFLSPRPKAQRATVRSGCLRNDYRAWVVGSLASGLGC
jgi:hypothetical protein